MSRQPSDVSTNRTMLGVIGCGNVAFAAYFPWLQQSPDVTVVGCFDLRQELAARAAALFPGAVAVNALDELFAIDGINAVVNLTPAPLHGAINAQALAAGLDCYSEKPLAGSVAEAQRLQEQADRAGLLLLAAPGTMATDRFRWFKSLLDSGELGRPTMITGQIGGMGPADWRGYTGDPSVFYRQGVGPAIDLGIYQIHAATGLFGPALRVQGWGGISIPQRTSWVTGQPGASVTVETPDHLLIDLDFGGETYAHLFSTYAVPASKAPGMEIHTTAGSISIANRPWFDFTLPVSRFTREDHGGTQQWDDDVMPPAPYQDTLGAIQAGIKHFVDVRAGRIAPILTARHATHVIEIIELAFRSMAEGRAFETTTRF